MTRSAEWTEFRRRIVDDLKEPPDAEDRQEDKGSVEEFLTQAE